MNEACVNAARQDIRPGVSDGRRVTMRELLDHTSGTYDYYDPTLQHSEAGLPAPVFADHGDTFVVTLYGHGARFLAQPSAKDHARQPAPARLQARRARQAWALDRMRTGGALGVREYAASQGVSTDTALRDLQDLVAGGRVAAHGTTSDRHYTLHRDTE